MNDDFGDGIAAPTVTDHTEGEQSGDTDGSTDQDGFYDPENDQGERAPDAGDSQNAHEDDDGRTADEPEKQEAAPAVKAADDDEPRRPRGFLDHDVKSVVDEFLAGTFVPKNKDGEDVALTPHQIAKRLFERGSSEKKPSTGAVTNVLVRWDEIGFAQITQKPTAFVAYIGDGGTETLNAALVKARADRRAAKAEVKAAANASSEAGDASA